MALDLAGLTKAVKGFQEKRQDNDKEWPKCCFLPDGNHKVRFITDPNDEVMIDYYAYGYFNKGIRDPSGLSAAELPEGFVNELGQFYDQKFKPLEMWKYGAKKAVLAYLYLYETDSPNDNWQPGNLYIIITGNKFQEAYTNFLSILAKDAPEEIIKTLDPSKAGVLLTLQFKGGSQGSCSIGATFPVKSVDPIDLSKLPYVSLETAYIKPGFNKEKYDALLAKYKEEYAKVTAAPGPTATEETLGEAAAAPNTEATGTSMLQSAAATAAPAQVTEQAATVTETPAASPVVTEAAAAPVTQTAAVTESAGVTTPATAAGGSVWDKFKSVG